MMRRNESVRYEWKGHLNRNKDPPSKIHTKHLIIINGTPDGKIFNRRLGPNSDNVVSLVPSSNNFPSI